MIKSVDGYADLDDYLLVNNKKNRSCKWIVSKEYDIGEYEFYFCELTKAYKEGKIVLKKYGE